MSARGAKKKQKTLSRSARAGVLFPVARMHRYLKKDPRHLRHRIGAGSPVYMAAVIEYLVAEILELAGNAAKEFKKSRIIPRHILLAIANDEELHTLLRHVTIAQGGVVQRINPFLIGPRSKANKAAQIAAAASVKTATKIAAKKLKTSLLATQSPSKAIASTGKGSLKKADSNVTLTLSEKKLANGQKLSVIQGDLIKMSTDAIVHPTNSTYNFGGEVGSAMLKAGGKDLQHEVDKLMKDNGAMGPAGASMCPSGNLKAKFVIHVNSPNWTDANAQKNLDKAVKNVLKLADDKNIKTVSIPSISSGHAGFPKQTAAQIILASIRDYFVSAKSSSLKHVTFVLYDVESVNVYTTELGRLDG